MRATARGVAAVERRHCKHMHAMPREWVVKRGCCDMKQRNSEEAACCGDCFCNERRGAVWTCAGCKLRDAPRVSAMCAARSARASLACACAPSHVQRFRGGAGRLRPGELHVRGGRVCHRGALCARHRRAALRLRCRLPGARPRTTRGRRLLACSMRAAPYRLTPACTANACRRLVWSAPMGLACMCSPLAHAR